MKYEDIENVNKQLKGIDVKGKNYIEVNQRIKAFRMLYPQGTIKTEIVFMDNGVITMRASIFNDTKLLATGTAQEKESSSFINKTSFVENCETSAVGRALGMLGIGIDTSIASAEEVINAINNQEDLKVKVKLFDKIKKIMEEKKITSDLIQSKYNKKSSQMSIDELNELIAWLETMEVQE